jgi:hypothetical protein
MKELNPLETQLRSWTPRRPSPKIERQLFGRLRWRFTLPRLVTVGAPTAACLLLTLAGWRHHGQPILPDDGSPTAMIALSLSNQSYAAYLPGNCQSSANRLDTFEWTNRGYSQSSVRSFTPPKATDLQ